MNFSRRFARYQLPIIRRAAVISTRRMSSNVDRSASILNVSYGSFILLAFAALTAITIKVMQKRDSNKKLEAGPIEIPKPDLLSKFTKNLANKSVKPIMPPEEFVARPAVSAALDNAINTLDSYCIVYGSVGVGKTTMVRQAVSGKKAVIWVDVYHSDTEKSVYAKIMNKVTGTEQSLDAQDLKKAISEFTAQSKDQTIPTIIFDTSPGVSGPVLDRLRAISNRIRHVCHCVIVAPDTSGVLSIWRDPYEQIVFIDEMTYEESKEILQKNNTPVKETDVRKIYDSIGGNPLLLSLLNYDLGSRSLDECIELHINRAKDDLYRFDLQPILLALKEKPDGVSPCFFDQTTYKGIRMVDTEEVGRKALKDTEAVCYNFKDRVYRVMTTRHKTALKDYEPTVYSSELRIPRTEV